jgi:hypothetical protein
MHTYARIALERANVRMCECASVCKCASVRVRASERASEHMARRSEW